MKNKKNHYVQNVCSTPYEESKKNVRHVMKEEIEKLKLSSTVARIEQISGNSYVVNFHNDETPYLYKVPAEF